MIGCLGVLGIAAVAGCGDDDDATQDAAAAKPASFVIQATAEGKQKKALEFPATVKAGLVTMTLKNADAGQRSAQLIRVVGEHTLDDVLRVITSDDGDDTTPSWIQDGGGLAAVKPGATARVTQVLAPGRYVLFDDATARGDGEGPSNAELGATGEFTVTGPASDAELPEAPATLTATDDGKDEYGFEFAGFKPGVNQVRFENTGEELHHALLFPINPGKTIEDAEKAFTSDAPPQGPPPVDFAAGTGTAVIDGGIAQNITLDLKPGRYAVVCFITDREGGKEHVRQGMIDELTVK
ncbi:MAG TPA: hypothetical protein VGV90_05565 [Solirubrobacteraceae bacterium]|nr:hypothetical protein [Solirubrobacteraceae bacterium]